MEIESAAFFEVIVQACLKVIFAFARQMRLA